VGSLDGWGALSGAKGALRALNVESQPVISVIVQRLMLSPPSQLHGARGALGSECHLAGLSEVRAPLGKVIRAEPDRVP